MNTSFEHFIITRFNLRQFSNVFDSDNEAWILWTRKRFAIFQEYCLPSILQQSTKNFKWLIYFDTATPPEFNNQILRLQQYDFIEICYADGYADFQLKHMRNIRLKIHSDTQWIITSRLDNDDCLHHRAMERIQKEFVPQDQFMVSLTSGYVYDMESRKLSKYYYPRSPFISLIEKNTDSAWGIYHRNHTAWNQLKMPIFSELRKRYFLEKEKWNTCFVLDEVLWMQLYHKENVANSFYNGFPVLKPQNLNDFGINIISAPSSFWSIKKYFRNYFWWKYYINAVIIRALRDEK